MNEILGYLVILALSSCLAAAPLLVGDPVLRKEAGIHLRGSEFLCEPAREEDSAEQLDSRMHQSRAANSYMEKSSPFQTP